MKTPKAKKLPSGAWFCRVRINGQDISITRATEKAAIAEAMALKAGIKEARKQDGAGKTLTKAIDEYIESRQNILSPSTVRGYRAIQKGRFQDMMRRKLSTLTQAVCQQAVNREARLCSAKTLKNAWCFLSSVILDATGTHIAVRLPQIVQKEKAYLTPDQILAFVEAIKGTSIEIPALLALSSLRRSEFINIRWTDVDMDRHVIRVNGAAVVDEHGKLVRKKENKNSTSRRQVPMIPQLYEALQRTPQTGEYIVTLTSGAIYKHVNRVCEKLGFPCVGLHGLRHSFASLAYHLEIPEKVAMEIGGWSDDRTMLKIYTHVSQNDIAKQATVFTGFFSKNGNENGNATEKTH